MGISLEEVASYLEAEAKGDREALQILREKHLCRTRSEIAKLQRIEAMLKQSDKELIKMALSEPVIKDVPALRVVSKRDKGSYDTLILTYKDIYEYMIKNKMEFAGPGRELYLSDPCKTAPEELLTEIQLPIRESQEKP